jgi:hypothetical protein
MRGRLHLKVGINRNLYTSSRDKNLLKRGKVGMAKDMTKFWRRGRAEMKRIGVK